MIRRAVCVVLSILCAVAPAAFAQDADWIRVDDAEPQPVRLHVQRRRLRSRPSKRRSIRCVCSACGSIPNRA